MNYGKKWEQKIKSMCKREKIFCYRLKDSPSSFYKGDKNLRFTMNNISDFFLYYDGCLLIVEAKSTAGTSLPYTNFRQTQIKELTVNTDRYPGVLVLCFIEFRKYNEAYIIPWSELKDFMDKAERKSWPYKYIAEKGTLIDSKNFSGILGGITWKSQQN